MHTKSSPHKNEKIFLFSRTEPYIIAEIGLHHLGRIDRAKQLIYLAKKGGAHAIKLQKFHNHDLYLQKDMKTMLMGNFSLSDEAYLEIADYCQTLDIDFICTAFQQQDIDFLEPIVPFYKIASCDLDHLTLIRHIAAKKKPTVVSTGGGSIAEISRAWTILEEARVPQIVLMHCMMLYPTPEDEANLLRITTLRERFPQAIVGYSDHTLASKNMNIMIDALILGAKVFEKHFTDNKMLLGLDHVHSMDLEDLKTFVKRSKEYPQKITNAGKYHKSFAKDQALGSKSQRKFIELSRRSLITKRALSNNHTISLNDLNFKRPQIGIPSGSIDEVLGRKTKRSLPSDHMISWEDIQ